MQSSHETLNVVEEKKQAEVGKDERVITEEMNGKELSPGSGPGEMRKAEPLTQKDSTSLSSESSSSSESEEEDAGEYRPHHRGTEGTIREEQEEEEEAGRAAKVVEREHPVPGASPGRQAGASVSTVETEIQENVVAPQIPAEKSVNEGAIKQDMSEETEDEQHKVNGEVSHVDIDVLPQIICCSEVNGRPKRELNSSCFSGGEHLPAFSCPPDPPPAFSTRFCSFSLLGGRGKALLCRFFRQLRSWFLASLLHLDPPDRVNLPSAATPFFPLLVSHLNFSLHVLDVFSCLSLVALLPCAKCLFSLV